MQHRLELPYESARSFATLALGALVALAAEGVAGCAKKPEAGPQAAAGELPKVEVWVAGRKLGPEGIPWEPKNLGKAQVLNRMRLLAQNGRWEPLDRLSSMAIEYDDKDLLAFGHWYRAILRGRARRADEAMAHLQVAVKFGFKNADDMLSNENLAFLAEREDFIQLAQGLKDQLARDLHEYFERLTDATLEAEASTEPWRPEVVSDRPEPLFAPGRPAIAVVARAHHDGLPKALDVLRDALAKSAGWEAQFSTALVLYEYDPRPGGDPAKTVKRAANYLGTLTKSHAVPERWGIVGHEDLLRLREALLQRDLAAREKKPSAVPKSELPPPTFACFPLTVFFDGGGTPRYAIEAVPELWQVEYAVARFAKTVSANAPEEKPAAEPGAPPELPPEPKAEAAPKEEPAAPSEPEPKPGPDPKPSPEPAG
ncbi:MAG: hypothetical protein ACUVYA_05335 [Planctomycetota bacterium]